MSKIYRLIGWALIFVWFGLVGTLCVEYVAHNRTRAELAACQAALEQCRAASAQAVGRAEALAQALTEAQAREAAWAEETAARAALVRNAQTGPRAKAEQEQVVDDDTRREAMRRLNRAW